MNVDTPTKLETPTNVEIPATFKVLVTSIPEAVLVNLKLLSWYNSEAPAWNAAYNLDSSALDILKLFDLSFKLPVPLSSMYEWLPSWYTFKSSESPKYTAALSGKKAVVPNPTVAPVPTKTLSLKFDAPSKFTVL